MYATVLNILLIIPSKKKRAGTYQQSNICGCYTDGKGHSSGPLEDNVLRGYLQAVC